MEKQVLLFHHFTLKSCLLEVYLRSDQKQEEKLDPPIFQEYLRDRMVHQVNIERREEHIET